MSSIAAHSAAYGSPSKRSSTASILRSTPGTASPAATFAGSEVIDCSGFGVQGTRIMPARRFRRKAFVPILFWQIGRLAARIRSGLCASCLMVMLAADAPDAPPRHKRVGLPATWSKSQAARDRHRNTARSPILIRSNAFAGGTKTGAAG